MSNQLDFLENMNFEIDIEQEQEIESIKKFTFHHKITILNPGSNNFLIFFVCFQRDKSFTLILKKCLHK